MRVGFSQQDLLGHRNPIETKCEKLFSVLSFWHFCNKYELSVFLPPRDQLLPLPPKEHSVGWTELQPGTFSFCWNFRGREHSGGVGSVLVLAPSEFLMFQVHRFKCTLHTGISWGILLPGNNEVWPLVLGAAICFVVSNLWFHPFRKGC